MSVVDLDPAEAASPRPTSFDAARLRRGLDPRSRYKTDPKRYRKVRRFFLRIAVHLVFWDILLNRPALQRFRRPPLERWVGLAREYRALAVAMGGVLIKLGQFLSTRVDLLPPPVIDELTGLQDEVPPVPTERVVALIEEDFGRPIAQVFPSFASEPVGSASLAQVHKATLPSGENVAVKVLRPGIAEIVATDLEVIGTFIRRLKRFKALKRYADLDRVAAEFVAVTSRELETDSEGRNAERFAREFEGDPRVLVPRVYWEYTRERTLTMEDVSYLRIDDVAALEAAGINLDEVAETLFGLYLDQLGLTYFVHADPHPGNLFVRPLSHEDEALIAGGGPLEFLPGDPVPYFPDRPFQIAFVDFGMAVEIPKRLHQAMRDYMIGIGTQDARMIVEAYLDAGILLPDADVNQIEEMTAALLERFSGSLLGQMKDVDLVDYVKLYAEYEALLYTSPMQVQADLLFAMRALGILSGLITQLAPDFDPGPKVVEFSGRLVASELRPQADRLASVAPRLLRLPGNLENVLMRAQRGQLVLQTNLTAEARRTVDQLRGSINRLFGTVVAVGLFLSGVVWHMGSSVTAAIAGAPGATDPIGVALMVAAGVVFVAALVGGRK